jgi:hypothetical protein
VPSRRLDTNGRMMLLQLLADLSTLSHWEPVGSFVEDMRLALSDGGCVAHKDLARVGAWAYRWRCLDGRLRALYADALRDPDLRWAAEAALWSILKGGPAAKGSVYAAMRKRWEDVYNEPPAIEVIPTRLVQL